eukprot:CAMPEP_0198567016 /NCGR_PEP_ID=MMETSP1462-20131121/104117_1 /TAXON_ID=1333877 /ORGANISM="Brandtodinium nutriculum, Strain RCC3387" /LENGTH=71 /DNA_ID=CAMNT_0044298057 /DNA_START=52 /DNA_END=267 /DNA_ORIENTATION=-
MITSAMASAAAICKSRGANVADMPKALMDSSRFKAFVTMARKSTKPQMRPPMPHVMMHTDSLARAKPVLPK